MPEQQPCEKQPSQKQPSEQPREHAPLLSRRTVLGGLALGAVTPLLLAQSRVVRASSRDNNQGNAFPHSAAASVPLLPRQMHTATALSGGGALVAGGLSGSGATLADAVVVEADGSVRPVAPLIQGRFSHAAVLLPDGRVLVLGGRTPAGVLAGAEIWDPFQNTWRAVTPLKIPRYGHAAVYTFGSTVSVIGGYSQGVLADIEQYQF